MTGGLSAPDAPHPVWPLLVALVAGLVYAGTLGNGFALDDLPQVRDNPGLGSWSAAGAAFGEPYSQPGGAAAGLYRPVVVASFVANRVLGGAEPRGFHAVNIALHMLASALVWYAVRGRSKLYGTPLAAALLFAVHPLHVEAVANVVGRAEILAAIGVLAAWLLHRRGAGGDSPSGWRIAAGVAYLFAVLSKESAVLAPLVFLIDDRIADGRFTRAQLARTAGYGLPFAVAMALRFQALGGLRGADTVAFIDNPAAFAGTAVRLATALWVQLLYVARFVWPSPLSSDYSYDAIPLVEGIADPRLAAAVLAAAAAVAALVVGLRRGKSWAPALAVWLVLFLPVSNIPFAIGTIMGERLAYLPLLGACWLAAHGIARLARWSPTRWGSALVGVATLALLATLAVVSVGRGSAWQDNDTLAHRDAAAMPRSAKLQAGVGIALETRGDAPGAEAAFRRAIEIYPDYAQMRFNLGQLLRRRGANAEAIEQLARAAELSPGNPRPFKALAPLLVGAGRLDEALEAYGAGARLDRGDFLFRFQHAGLLLRRRRSADGLAALEALARDDSAGIHGRVASAFSLELNGRRVDAESAYRKLLDDPALPEALRPQIGARLEAVSSR